MKIALSLTFVLMLAAVPASANLVVPIGFSNQILVPAAGSVAGANNTFFRSEITIVNYRNVDQSVQLLWLPQGSTAGAPQTITIRAGSGISSLDFVAQVMGKTGLGSIVITGLVANTSFIDTNARLYVTSRIYSPQPGTNGFVSQTFSTIPTQAINYTQVSMVGIRRDAQYRLNAGVVNLDSNQSQTFRITLGNSLGGSEVIDVVVLPLSMQQVAFSGPPFANPQILVENITPSATRTTRWTSYASSIDNVTGDSFSVVGFERPDVSAP